jgi:hypothetical protein
MQMTSARRTGIAVFAFLALVLLMVPFALHAANTPAVLEACVNPGNGNMRLVDSSTACHTNETRVTWNVEGPPGDPGPPGPSSGGPPFVWTCTPGHFTNGGASTGDIYVFNAGSSTATIAVNFLDRDGNNLAGVAIPGGGGDTYPGEAGAGTVTLAAGHTRDLHYKTPDTTDPITNIVFTIRITSSDQPITAAADLVFSGFHPFPCTQVPK